MIDLLLFLLACLLAGFVCGGITAFYNARYAEKGDNDIDAASVMVAWPIAVIVFVIAFSYHFAVTIFEKMEQGLRKDGG